MDATKVSATATAIGNVVTTVLAGTPEGTIAAVAVNVVEAAIADEPALVAEFKAIFSGGTPTADQFAALRAKVSAENFGVDSTNG